MFKTVNTSCLKNIFKTFIEFDYDYFSPTEEENKMFEYISEDLAAKKIKPSIMIMFDHS